MDVEKMTKWMTKYAKYETTMESTDEEGNYNGMKMLVGHNGTKFVFKRITFTMDILWPAPIGFSPLIKQHEFWLVN
jgi:hypothetical protein